VSKSKAETEPKVEPSASADAAPQSEAADVERLQSELAEARDRTLRVQAELENFRRRSRRELQDELKYANVPLLRDLMPVVDNMERAIEAAQKTDDAASLLEGFRMVKQQLVSVLERHHCVVIPALGQPFDPNLHEAISMQPSADQPANTVLYVAQTGYQLHDRVVRPTQVIVSTVAGGRE
jgi:molecular chaperone GrpE